MTIGKVKALTKAMKIQTDFWTKLLKTINEKVLEKIGNCKVSVEIQRLIRQWRRVVFFVAG